MFDKLKARATAMKTISALLTQAEQIARAGGAEQPAAEHLVMAALQLPDGTAALALERLGSSAADFGAALQAQEAEDLERIGVHADTRSHRSSTTPDEHRSNGAAGRSECRDRGPAAMLGG